MIFFRKPLHTFRDHALGDGYRPRRLPAVARDALNVAGPEGLAQRRQHGEAALLAGALDLVEQGMAAADELHGAMEAAGGERGERRHRIEAAQVRLEEQHVGRASTAGADDVGLAAEPLGNDLAIGEGQLDDATNRDIAIDDDATQ